MVQDTHAICVIKNGSIGELPVHMQTGNAEILRMHESHLFTIVVNYKWDMTEIGHFQRMTADIRPTSQEKISGMKQDRWSEFSSLWKMNT